MEAFNSLNLLLFPFSPGTTCSYLPTVRSYSTACVACGSVNGLLIVCWSPIVPVLSNEATWVVDADGSWLESANWSSHPNLPGPGDDVVIDVGGSTVRRTEINPDGFNIDFDIRSLQSQEALTISGYSSLTLTGGLSRVHEAFEMGVYAVLTVEGAGTEFVAIGSTDLESADLFASNGGVLRLPNLTSYSALNGGGTRYFNGGWECFLRLDCMWIHTVIYREMDLNASDGGVVDLSRLRFASPGALTVTCVCAGSRID